MRIIFAFACAVLFSAAGFSQDLKGIERFQKFEPKKAPAPKGLMLKKGDRLAICGDSITEQKMYVFAHHGDVFDGGGSGVERDGAAIWLERRNGAGISRAHDE